MQTYATRFVTQAMWFSENHVATEWMRNKILLTVQKSNAVI